MRYFFACSIGFTIPVEDFGNVVVWKRALLLLSQLIQLLRRSEAKVCSGEDWHGPLRTTSDGE